MTTKKDVKALWKRCFDDSDEFVELYFEHRYKDEFNVAIELNGKTVSALQIFPYSMTFGGETVLISYISGACTHPSYRRQGLMGALLTEVHQRMYKEGVLLTMLIPTHSELFGFYAKRGYASAVYCSRLKIKADSLLMSQLYTIADETEDNMLYKEHYRYFSSKMKERLYYVQHTREDLFVVMEALHLNGGKLLVARRGGLIHGMAFCVMKEGLLTVAEMLADNVVVKDSLLKKAAILFQVDELVCLQPPQGNKEQLGMVRIVQADKLLKMFAKKHPEVEIQFRLVDEDIPKNNACYCMARGECIREYGEKGTFRLLTIKELARLLFKRESPYMSLMLN